MWRKSRMLGMSGAAILSGVFGGSTVLSESRPSPHLINEREVKNLLTQKHGEDKVTYFDLSELPTLGEDANCDGVVGQYRCFGIFDGHAGWCTSDYVSKHILDYLRTAHDSKLNSGSGWLSGWLSKPEEKQNELSSTEMDEAIHDAFVKLDNDILQAPLKALKLRDPKMAAASLPLASNGCCAMMTFYNPLQNLLKVALVGDSRTVLGVQDSEGLWHAKNLTYDQTGSTPSERKRIMAEHPYDSPDILRGGRILGYEPTRSFGDANTKYTKEQQLQLRAHFWWSRPNPLLSTPPYMTAKPVISTVELDPSKPSFIVMGCDGLYEWLTNAQVVDLVGQWLEKNPVILTKKYAGTVDKSDDDSSKSYSRPKALNWGPLKPIVTDDNAGTHLIRNALGGAEFEKVSLLMSIPAPRSRRFRDDITCTVVFFTPQIQSKL